VLLCRVEHEVAVDLGRDASDELPRVGAFGDGFWHGLAVACRSWITSSARRWMPSKASPPVSASQDREVSSATVPTNEPS